MDQRNICKEGIVREINGDEITLEITVSSACSGCHAKALCMSSETKQQFITAKNVNNASFEIGEIASIRMKESLGNKAVVIAYLLPLFVLAISLFVTYGLTKNEPVSIIVCLSCTVLYYLIIKIIHKKIDEKFIFYVEKKKEENI